MARKQKSTFQDNRDRLKALESVATSFRGWRPGAEIQNVQAVPTVFPQYNKLTGVGGIPIARVNLVRGPTNQGKTAFILGLMRSFLERYHFAGFVDAERTTPKNWMTTSLTEKWQNAPTFNYLPCSTYEHAVDGVRDFCEKIANARVKGAIPPETSGIIVVDSIRKLVPKNILTNLLKDGAAENSKSKGADGYGGRAAQLKAALNAAWMDELVPLMADTNIGIVLISRETEDQDGRIKVGGGKAIAYDSSLDHRIRRESHVEDAEGNLLGEKHQITIKKTKVAVKGIRDPFAFFHTSNGVIGPAGFDTARDYVDMGIQSGLVQQTGAWYEWPTGKKHNGQNQLVKWLYEDPGRLNELAQAIEDGEVL